jgi:hypothetical protein
MKTKRVNLLLISFLMGVLFSLTAAVPSNAAPDYTSTYLPEIISFKSTVATVARTEKAFGNDFMFESKEFIFDLTVRVHRNTISGLSIIMQGPAKPTSSLAAPCETFEGSIFSGALRYGSDYQSASSWAQLSGLQSRVQDGDFYIEKYQIKGDMDWTFADDRNEGMGFCAGSYSLAEIDVWDIAKRKIALYLPGSATAKYYCVLSPSSCLSGVQITDFWKTNNLNTNPCPIIRGFDYNNDVFYKNCFSGDWSSLNFSISKTNVPTVGKLEIIDYKSLLESSLKVNVDLAAQVKSLTADKTSLQSQLTTLAADKSTLQGQVASLTADKSTLQNQLITLTADKSTLQGQVASLTADKSTLQNQLITFTSEKNALQNQVASITANLNSASIKIKKVCSTKPKPKAC